MMRWPAGALRRYAAARGDENIDYMVTRGRLERRERRTARAGLDGHGGQPAADLLPGMRLHSPNRATARTGERSGIYLLKERRSLLMPASGAGGVGGARNPVWQSGRRCIEAPFFVAPGNASTHGSVSNAPAATRSPLREGGDELHDLLGLALNVLVFACGYHRRHHLALKQRHV